MAQKLTRRQFMALSGLSLSTLVLPSCSSAPTPTSPTASHGPQKGGTLRIAFTTPPLSLDPPISSYDSGAILLMSVYDTLVWNDKTYTPQPGLATSWKTSADGLQWTFKLRSGVKFHHGTPFTAKDVVYTFERLLKPENGFPSAFILAFIERVTAIDDHTVQFKLKYPNVDLLLILGDHFSGTFIVSHDRTSEQLSTTASGTGPYILKEFVQGTQATLVRNDNYWREGLPYFDEIRHLYIAEKATQIVAFESNEVDVLFAVPSESVGTFEKNPKAKIIEVAGGSSQPIVLPTSTEVFADNRVRQALKCLVDRESMVKMVLQGSGEVGNDQPVVPNHQFWGNLQPYEHNVEKAKKLLAEAGYPNGFTTKLATSTLFPGMLESAVAFQEMVKAAGVTIEIEKIEPSSYLLENNKYPMFMSNCPTVASLDLLFTLLFHSNSVLNESGFKNAEFDKLVEVARSEQDVSKRKKMYVQAQKIIQEKGGVIISYFRHTLFVQRSNIEGLIFMPNQMIYPHAGYFTQS